MGENMEKYRHIDGSGAISESPYIRITFQHGPPEDGINGCRIEDVIELLISKLLDFQGRDMACEENALALEHLQDAQEALVLRRNRREKQQLIGKRETHKSKD